MARKVTESRRYINGIADYQKEGLPDSYAFGRSVDHRSDPRSIELLPRTVKESGNNIVDLPLWGEIVSTDIFLYGDTGTLYKRTSASVYTNLRSVPTSHGNGLGYFGEDDFLYYTGDKVIGRYGPMSGTPIFSDDFLGSQGGVPLNTASLDLEASSSQYASRADTASLSITGNLSVEAQIKPESLPTGSGQMTLVSKWTENGNLRSYKFGIGTASNYFGNGADGALTISSNTTEAPIDSACTGTTGTYTLSATNASFAADQIILIHQTTGTGAGAWQRNKIQSYTAGTITLVEALNTTYVTGAQVRVVKQHTDVTVNTGITYTAKAWNGTVGGILAFIASGTVTVTGTITASGKGYRGGASVGPSQGANGNQGEGENGTGSASTAANGQGGGGGSRDNIGTGATAGGGGGGGSGTTGTTGQNGESASNPGGTGGSAGGSADLTTMRFGGGGGSGGTDTGGPSQSGAGGIGGGAIFIAGVTITVTGAIASNGTAGQDGISGVSIGGGGGAGGSILLKGQVNTLGSSLITATGGAGGAGGNGPGGVGFGTGGAGAVGRIHLDYLTSYTGTTSPTLNVTQDSTLGSSDGHTLLLSISSNGTAVTTYSKPATFMTGVWQHVAASYTASAGDVELFLNGVSLGTVDGSTTSISDNTSTFNVGMDVDGAGAAQHFYDGLIDEVRIFNVVRTQAQYLEGMSSQILTTTAGMQGYWKLNGDYVDATANANTLTATNTPVFSTDVPYPSPTTRLDIDQSATTSSQTYTPPTAIAETATNRKTFTPEKDPQKSLSVLIASVGTGNWTVTVHDQYNNTVATVTVANAALAVGYYEFIFSTTWRPLINADYHFHVTSTVADGTVTTGSNADLETVSYRTYFQFLVTDTAWHPVARFLQFLVFGNERYVAKWEATLYEPNHITLPAGYKVRCFGYWREYLAIGTTRGTNIYEQDAGRIYFWDGIAPTYNFFIDVPEGGINAMYGTKGLLYVFAGYQGDLLLYQGGDSAQKVKQVPKMTPSTYMEVYPSAITMWKTLLRFGVAGGSDSTTLQKGVYTWGKLNNNYNDSLSYDSVISTGTYTGTGVKIGLTMVYNKNLLIGWQDGTGYGIDYVSSANDVYPTGTIEFLIDDDGAMWKEKEAQTLVAQFSPLVSGQSVNIKYKLNREDTWTELGAVTTEDATEARLTNIMGDTRYREYQYAVDLATTISTGPKLLGIGFERETLTTEEQV
jgi:hypothetical protein